MTNETATAYSSVESNSSPTQVEQRAILSQMFHKFDGSDEELLTQLGLFIRSSYLVKFLVLNDLYLRIMSVPGDVLEFGTRFGHNLVVFENLRAIYEPFNKTRRMVGFDTFEGYRGFSKEDREGEVFSETTYTTFTGYEHYLEKLLAVHEKSNVLGHISGNHRVVKGDVRETAPRYFADHPETTVAMAYFDMGLYEPTKLALQAIKPHLIPGSVILLDEFTWSESPGEAIAFREVFGQSGYTIEKSKLTPMRAIVTIK
jgi:hypothetical protein